MPRKRTRQAGASSRLASRKVDQLVAAIESARNDITELRRESAMNLRRCAELQQQVDTLKKLVAGT